MKTRREVESGPFQDLDGLWHNPDGSFMDDDEAAALDREYNLERRNGRRRSRYHRKPESRLKGSNLRVEELMTEFHQIHARMGEIIRELDSEFEELVLPLKDLAERFGTRRGRDTHQEPEQSPTEDSIEDQDQEENPDSSSDEE